jgi:Ca2+-transporting ATPase
MERRQLPEAFEAYRLPPEHVLEELGTAADAGLDAAEAQRRLKHFGPNELEAERPVPAWRKFLAQFEDPLVILLLIATVIATGVWWFEGDAPLPYDAIAILAVVILNAVMGYVQQARAEQAVAALHRMSAATARVIRGGKQLTVPASELVPGDIFIIEEGDTIPADARLIRATSLQTAEAALTGESEPVTKDVAAIDAAVPLGDRTNMVFSGTIATYGHGVGVVTATGMRSQLGRIAGMLGQQQEVATPLQKELARVGKLLGIVVIAIAIVMIATILFVGHVRTLSGLFDVFILGVALAVAAVPEGLPAIVTAVLALGVQRMAKRNAIVRHLAAVETLGSANVIASDKTGTLTKNEMTVRSIATASGRVNFTGTGYAPEGELEWNPTQADAAGALQFEARRALLIGDRANNASLQQHDGRWTVHGDPTEGALLVAARKAGFDPAAIQAQLPRIAEVPFSSDRKVMTSVHTDAEQPGRVVAFVKGAADVLLKKCSSYLQGEAVLPLDDERRRAFIAANEHLASDALRTLGLAFRELPPQLHDPKAIDHNVEQDLVFVGLVGMIDPPREEAAVAVARAQAAGIRPLMITGDHPTTAAVIAKELGIARGEPAISGAQIEEMSDEQLRDAVRRTSVYARVNPSHKLRIVKVLQEDGLVVAMTGDGVNDAPALKSADIGVAMGITGTDVSKQASDIVLADDNFASIVAAVEEGRTIFANIRKFLRYLLSCNIGEVMTMFFGVVLANVIGLTSGDNGIALPLLATQILWVNLVTDGLPALALGVDPADRNVMNQHPRRRGEGVLTARMFAGIVYCGTILAAGTLFVIDMSLPGGLIEGAGSIEYAQTMAFTTIVFASLFMVFNARSDDESAFVGLFSNRWLWGAVFVSLVLQVAVVYVPFLQKAFSSVPLSWNDWLICAAVGSVSLWLREFDKLMRRLIRRRV